MAGIYRLKLCVFLIGAVLMAGCTDPLTRHNVLTTLFDGVPDLPPVEKLCEDNMGDKYKEFYTALAAEREKAGEGTDKRFYSKHPPFTEKKCQGCHDFKKTNRLIVPRNELCYVCHKDFIKGKYVHGPIAVGDCLACHLPHESKHTALLQESRNEICSKCHQEGRLAEQMHDKVVTHNMNCIDCHDPHSSKEPYFLK